MPFQNLRAFAELVSTDSIDLIVKNKDKVEESGTNVFRNTYDDYSRAPVDTGASQDNSYVKVTRNGKYKATISFIIAEYIYYAIYWVYGLGTSRVYGPRDVPARAANKFINQLSSFLNS